MGTTLKKREDLDQYLAKAHAMLTSIDIPVAPLDTIQIYMSTSRKRKLCGMCFETDDGFQITIHRNYQEEPIVDGIAKNTMSIILHELLHTCWNEEEKAYGLFVHDKTFIHYSKICNQKLGFNPLETVEPSDFALTAAEPIHVFVCSHCGAKMAYYSEAAWIGSKLSVEAFINDPCWYCGDKAVSGR